MLRTLKRRHSLGTARRLMEAGKADEAIALLTAANAADRDARVERCLVELRYEAFRATADTLTSDAAQRPQPWHGAGDDRFTAATIPEIAASELSVDVLRNAMRHHGTLLVRGLLDRDRVDHLVRDMDQTFDAFDADADGATSPDLLAWYQRFEHRFIRETDRERKRERGAILAIESPRTLFDLVETLKSTGVVDLAHDYFGEPPTMLARKVTLRRMLPPHGQPGGWHQDGAFMGADIWSLNLWIALSHCGDDAPGLDVAARRLTDLVPTGNGAYADWGIKDEDAEAAAGVVVRPVFEAGDALLFDHLCLHRTARTPEMPNPRYAIEAWLFAPSTYGSMTTSLESGYSPRDQVPLVI